MLEARLETIKGPITRAAPHEAFEAWIIGKKLKKLKHSNEKRITLMFLKDGFSSIPKHAVWGKKVKTCAFQTWMCLEFTWELVKMPALTQPIWLWSLDFTQATPGMPPWPAGRPSGATVARRPHFGEQGFRPALSRALFDDGTFLLIWTQTATCGWWHPCGQSKYRQCIRELV